MARYFFHVQNGHLSRDSHGTELPGIREAKMQAVHLSGQLLHADQGTFWDSGEWRMEVTDRTGLVLFALDFVATEAPSLRGTGASSLNPGA